MNINIRIWGTNLISLMKLIEGNHNFSSFDTALNLLFNLRGGLEKKERNI